MSKTCKIRIKVSRQNWDVKERCAVRGGRCGSAKRTSRDIGARDERWARERGKRHTKSMSDDVRGTGGIPVRCSRGDVRGGGRKAGARCPGKQRGDERVRAECEMLPGMLV